MRRQSQIMKFTLYACICCCLVLFANKCWAQRRTAPASPSAPDNQPKLVVKPGYENAVNAVAVAPDGSSILIGGADGTARVVDIKSGREQMRLAGYAEEIERAAFSPAGRFALLANDATVYLWDLSIGQQTASWPARATALAPDENSVLLVGSDGVARLVQARTSVEIRRFRVIAKDVTRIVFSPRGNLALLVDDKGAARLVDYLADKEVQLFRSVSSSQAIAFAPDGRAVVYADTAGSIHLWDLTTGREVRLINAQSTAPVFIRYLPDGRTLMSATHTGDVLMIDVPTGRLVRKLEVGTLAALEFAPDGKTFATGGPEGLRLWDVQKGAAADGFAPPPNAISSIAFTPDGHMILTCGQDKAAHLLDAATGEALGQLYTFRPEVGAGSDANQWLVDRPDGLFDGSQGGWEQTLWRGNNTFDIAPVESYFSDFFYPGLLGDLLSGRRPQSPPPSDVIKDRRPPKVKLVLAPGQESGPSGLTTHNIKVQIEVAEAPKDGVAKLSGGVNDLRLFRNGLLVKAWRGDVLHGKPYTTIEAELPITAGENRLSAYAFNRDNVSSPTTRLVVTGAPSLKRQGTAYIIAVGINQYDNPEFNNKYAVADAKAFGEELQRQQTKLNTFGRVELITLSDQEATKANIMAVLRRLAGTAVDVTPKPAGQALDNVKRAEPEDALLIYFASHGVANDNHFYLIPHDMGFKGKRGEIKAEDLQRILEHGISDSELADVFSGIDAGRFLIVLDTAGSGQALESEDKRFGPMNAKGFAQLAYEKGIAVLTAAQAFQGAHESGQFGHGLLTYALVEEGLKTTAADIAPKDGKVSLLEWLEYAAKRVPEMQIEMTGKEARHHTDLDLEGLRNLQRPRIFYRRETEPQSFIVAMPTRPLEKKPMR